MASPVVRFPVTTVFHHITNHENRSLTFATRPDQVPPHVVARAELKNSDPIGFAESHERDAPTRAFIVLGSDRAVIGDDIAST